MFKNAAAIEAAARVQVVIMDKTWHLLQLSVTSGSPYLPL
jgi:cation transport ATPase